MEERNIVAYFSGLSATIKSVRAVQKLYNPHLAFNFNPINFLRPGENKYSEILAFFLNPKEAHGQGDIFLKLFLKSVGLFDKVAEIGFADVKCKCEHGIENQRRIDILIKLGGNKFIIAIENKIWAIDQANQLSDYNNHLNQKYPGNYCLLYLTPYRKPPAETSIETVVYKELETRGVFKLIGYKEHIIDCVHNWAMNCQAERVRIFLLDFEQYLKREFLGQTFMEENETVAQYAVKSAENIEVAFATYNAMSDIKKKLLGIFKAQIKEIAAAHNLITWIHPRLGLDDDYSWFSFYKESWNFAKITFQFGSKNGNNFRYGINLNGAGGSEDVPIIISDELEKAVLQIFNVSRSGGDWWLFHMNFDSSVRNWESQSKPWKEIQNGEMQKRVDALVKGFIEKIGGLAL